MTLGIQDILSSRVHCHTDAGGRVYQSLTLPAGAWLELAARIRRLETESECLREWTNADPAKRTIPQPEQMRRALEWSKGAVTPNDWIQPAAAA